MNIDGKSLNTEHEELKKVRIPDKVLRMYTTCTETKGIPPIYVQLMAKECLEFRKLAK